MPAAPSLDLAEAVEQAVAESLLTSRERWARWEELHGWGSSHGLHSRGERGSEPPSHEAIQAAGMNEWPKPSAHSHAQILKGAADTQQLHAPNGAYSRERKVLHDKIVAHFLKGKTKAKGQPEALFMAGGAASGKTRALKDNPHFKPHDAVEINPDEIKEHLPEYHAMVKHGDKAAAAAVHEESSDIAKRLLHEAKKGGHNVLIDGTGDSKRGKFQGKLKAMHDAGYKVSALYVTVPTETAVERAVERAHRTGRHVPIPEVRQQHKNVSAWFHDVASEPYLHRLEVHDTSSGKAVKLVSASKGKLTVHDHAGFHRFIQKGHE